MSKKSKITYLFISILFFIFFDNYFSNAILNNSENLPPNPILDLIFLQNTGAAFSILQNSKMFLILFSAVAILFILFYTLKHIKSMSGVAVFWTSLLISGVFCNMYERITLGYVRDFFKLNFIDFPVFNISDVFINISVFAIILIIIKHNYTKNNEINN